MEKYEKNITRGDGTDQHGKGHKIMYYIPIKKVFSGI